MANRRHKSLRDASKRERVSRRNMHLVALAGATLVGLYFCYRVVEPFLPALAWAVALAVISHPAHAWIRKYIRNDSWAAAVSTTLVVLVILVPSLLAGAQLIREAGQAGQLLKEQAENGKLRELALRLPYGDEFVPWVEANYNLDAIARELATFIARDGNRLLQGSVWAALQALVTVFVLFYCFRDRDRLLRGVRALIPFPAAETEETFRRVDDSIHATVYATIVCSLLQGVTGGLLFWALGLPAPVLWGVVMFILGVIPMVGAFLVWVPAAALLVSQDRYWAAAILVAWGLLMAGPILNYLYAHLAGGRMRMHPVPALIAFIGGLAVFGVTGMILGPVIVVLTMELIDAWRRRAVPKPPTAASEMVEPVAV
jgi:predicted PurR-regulated permease PerM